MAAVVDGGRWLSIAADCCGACGGKLRPMAADGCGGRWRPMAVNQSVALRIERCELTRRAAHVILVDLNM